VAAARDYRLEPAQAREIIDAQVAIIRAQWHDAADQVGLTRRERDQMWGRQILNDFAFEGLHD
jgi:serine/threonine-protein kinase HipA